MFFFTRLYSLLDGGWTGNGTFDLGDADGFADPIETSAQGLVTEFFFGGGGAVFVY